MNGRDHARYIDTVTSGPNPADIPIVPKTSRGANLVRFARLARKGRPALAGLLSLVFSMATLYAAEGIRIVPLVRDDSVLVSFELTDGYTAEVSDVVKSGLKTTFTYTVELRQDVPAWVDRTIATSVVTNTVQYDNLTRRATLVRTLDGHVESTESTEDEAVIKLWMTTFQKMPLFKTAELEQNREYYVRVRATARPVGGSLLWPFGTGISGITKFTFLR